MARKVKLQDTGEYSTSDIAYRGSNGKYYSSKESFEKYNKNKEYRQKCINLMFDIMGYKDNMILPTYFYKSLTKFEGVGYEALYNTMIRQDGSVQWTLKNKYFNSETGKIMYVMAIYNNNIMDEYKKIVADERAKKHISAKNEEIAEVSTEIKTDRKQETKNISKFLED